MAKQQLTVGEVGAAALITKFVDWIKHFTYSQPQIDLKINDFATDDDINNLFNNSNKEEN